MHGTTVKKVSSLVSLILGGRGEDDTKIQVVKRKFLRG